LRPTSATLAGALCAQALILAQALEMGAEARGGRAVERNGCLVGLECDHRIVRDGDAVADELAARREMAMMNIRLNGYFSVKLAGSRQ
jgi:hypothetical protein